jgi:hypothetical protein
MSQINTQEISKSDCNSYRAHDERRSWSAKVAGGSPAAGVFLLFGQKKVTKEKAAPANRR